MSTDKTPEDQVTEAQANELEEGQLDQVAGGLPAVQLTAAADGSVRGDTVYTVVVSNTGPST
jgi:hypothetical protein